MPLSVLVIPLYREISARNLQLRKFSDKEGQISGKLRYRGKHDTPKITNKSVEKLHIYDCPT